MPKNEGAFRLEKPLKQQWLVFACGWGLNHSKRIAGLCLALTLIVAQNPLEKF